MGHTEKYKKGFEHYFYICKFTGLRKRCVFGLATKISGRFSTSTELEINRFRALPFGDVVWKLIPKVNSGLLAAYITVFDSRREKRRWFIPYLVFTLVYTIISSNLVTLATLSHRSGSVCTHTCSPFSRKPFLKVTQDGRNRSNNKFFTKL